MKKILSDMFVDMSTTAAERLGTIKSANMLDKINTTGDGGVRYSIRRDIVDINGKEYDSVVELDKRVSARTLSESKRLMKYIEHNLVGVQIPVIDAFGSTEIIEFARPNEVTYKNGKRHPVLGELKFTTGDTRKQVIINAVEVIGESMYDPQYSSTDNEHGWLDKNGWESRKTFVLAKDGNIYEAYLKIAKAKDGRNILYAVNLDINKGIAVDQGATQKRAAVKSAMPSSKKIPQRESVVKQISTTDSDGNQLSAGQIEFFKDSKVRDENGNLLVVYHGTNAVFTVFDKRKAKLGAFGKGFYFAPTAGRAKAYGSAQVMETYLNVRNPYVVKDSLGFTIEDYRQMQKEFGIKDKITDNNVMQVLKNQRYDGIMVEDANGNLQEVVVFEPTQIKSVDNKNPTDNPDIRYRLAAGPDLSARTLLTDPTVEGKNDAQKLNLQRYRDAVAKADGLEAHRKDFKKQYDAMTDEQKKSAEGRKLRGEITKAENRLKLANEAVQRLEQSRPLQELLPELQENAKVRYKENAKAALAEMEAEYGTIPAGEKAVRDDALPVSTDGKDKVSRAARTVKGAQVRSERVAAAEKAVTDVYNKAKKALEEGGEKVTASLHYADGVEIDKLSKTEKDVATFAAEVAPSLTTDIVLYRDENSAAMGYYDHNTDSIYLNVAAKVDLTTAEGQETAMVFTMGHELAHRAKVGSPQEFDAFTQFLIQEYGKAGVDLDTLIGEQIHLSNEHDKTLPEDQRVYMTREMALEEVVAEACSRMLVDTNAGKKLATWGRKSEANAKFVQKLKDMIYQLIIRLRKALKGADPGSLSAEAFTKLDGKVKKILSDMFVDMSTTAAERLGTIKSANMLNEINTTGDGGVRYAINKQGAQVEITTQYQKTVDAILNGTHRGNSAVLMGYTPDVYQDLGMPSLPFVIGPGHIYASAKTKAQAQKENRYNNKMHYHGLGDLAVKDLYKAAQNPVMIIASKDVDPNAKPLRSTHSVVAIVDVGTGLKQLLLPIEITATRTVNGQQMDVNVLSSSYIRDVYSLVREAVALENTGDIGVYYIKKGATLPTDSGVQFPVHLSSKVASGGIIHRLNEKVNMNIAHQTQSRQFARWFGDWLNNSHNASKVVNPDGTPKIMYHGTKAENGEFYIFDESQAKKKGGLGFKALGKGNYFTAKKLDGTERYGSRVIAAYLDIKTPFVFDGGVSFREQVSKELGVDAESMSHDEIQIAMRNKGYDGVIQYDKSGEIQLAVTFDSNQIKSVKNIGTFDGGNPDIRYRLAAGPDLSARTLLTNPTVEGKNDAQKLNLQRYRDAVAKADGLEAHRKDVQAQYNAMTAEQKKSAEGRKLRGEITKAENRLKLANEAVQRLEQSRPLQTLVKNQRDRVFRDALREEEKQNSEMRSTRRKKTEMRHKIQRVVKELNDLLLSDDKKRHVPDKMKKAVAEALDLVNMDTVGAVARVEKYEKLIADEQAKANPDHDKIDAYTVTMENIMRQGEKMSEKLGQLHSAYKAILTSDDPDIQHGYDASIADAIAELSETIGSTPISKMSMEQPEDVYNVYKAVLTRVRDARDKGAVLLSPALRQLTPCLEKTEQSPCPLYAYSKRIHSDEHKKDEVVRQGNTQKTLPKTLARL